MINNEFQLLLSENVGDIISDNFSVTVSILMTKSLFMRRINSTPFIFLRNYCQKMLKNNKKLIFIA